MAVASLVLGIVSLVWSLIIPVGKFIGVILGIIAVALGALGRKDPERKGMATAGLVTGILGLIFGLIIYIACASALGGAYSFFNSFS